MFKSKDYLKVGKDRWTLTLPSDDSDRSQSVVDRGSELYKMVETLDNHCPPVKRLGYKFGFSLGGVMVSQEHRDFVNALKFIETASNYKVKFY